MPSSKRTTPLHSSCQALLEVIGDDHGTVAVHLGRRRARRARHAGPGAALWQARRAAVRGAVTRKAGPASGGPGGERRSA
jgi:hypothetical protein